MPKKRGRPRKTQVIHKKKTFTAASVLASIRSVRWTESYTSLLMGVVVVIVAVLFVVSILRQTHHIQDTSSISTELTPTVSPQPSELKPGQKSYTVQSGDNLWSISEKFYKSGYNWVDIAKANNLSDPSTIHSGNVLVIPSVAPKETTITPVPVAVLGNAITGDTYTVKPGDDLWNIAVRAYADGYQWTKIAQANNLSNPSLIFSGNILKIPR